MLVSIRFNVLKKMDTTREDIDALARLAQAMIDDLIERRQVRDPELFKYCFEFVTGEDDRFLVIIGPCSADHEDSVLEYVSRLVPVQEKVKEDYRGEIYPAEDKDEWGVSYGDAHDD